MSQRIVVSELLDHLATDDPEAQRSRRDLRRINFLMGNERWVCRAVERFSAATNLGISEIGAGDGRLSAKLADQYPSVPVAAYDLAPRPPELDARVKWIQGDLFTQPCPEPGGLVVANLFLHHFEGEALLALGRWMENAAVVIFNEPDRGRLPHVLGSLLWPWINRVTRHDMHVSISAGFVSGELVKLLGLDLRVWHFEENSTWRGGRGVIAWRR
jgi:O-methyltransferase domain